MNSTAQAFEQFLATQSLQVELLPFVINLVITAVLGYILSRIYIRFGTSLSNRVRFGGNFILIAMTTMVIITIVKSSLALSLGLVGALSIVRFRAAIKEPEELSYLFHTIAIGLGLGANQRAITIVAFVMILAVTFITKRSSAYKQSENLHLKVSAHEGAKFDLNRIVGILKDTCMSVKLLRLDESKGTVDASFLVEFADFSGLARTKDEIHKLDDSIYVTFLDSKGIS